jgi:predicted RecB family nuclease
MLRHKNSIDLFWNLRKNSREDLRAKGIFTMEQFLALSLEDIAKIKGIKSTAHRYKAQAEAYVNRCPVRYGEMPSLLKNDCIMFDLETDVSGERDFHTWCMGWSDAEGKTKIAIVNPHGSETRHAMDEKTEILMARSPEAVWWLFHDDVCSVDAPILHWTGYDVGAMKRTAPQAVQDALLPRMHDLCDSFVKSVQLPISSYSIKEVARYYGFDWQEHDNWQQAFWDYRSWLRTGNPRLLEQASRYQRDDVLSMLVVWKNMLDME